MPDAMDPKAYAARVTQAKKVIANNPDAVQKIKEMYAPAKKVTGSQPDHHVTDSKNTTKPLTGAAAIAALQNQVSPSGVKQAEANAKKAIDKKYPGLYKK